MRSSVLLLLRMMTSSRQSPRTSALRLGVLFEPLFDEVPERDKTVCLKGVTTSYRHVEIVFPSKSSRRGSAFHQTPKFTGISSLALLPPPGVPASIRYKAWPAAL